METYEMNPITKTIDQAGLAKLIRERADEPAKFTGRPLVVWQAALDDGVTFDILFNIFHDYNRGKAREEKKTFWYPTAEVYSLPDKTKCFGLCALTVSNPDEIPALPTDIPVVVFLDCTCANSKPSTEFSNAEQYLFAPDFEQWAAHNRLPDFMKEFIRQGGDHEGIIYRWYNRYNSSAGCNCPEDWFRTKGGLIPPQAQRKWEGRVCDYDENTFRQACSGMSADLVDAFRRFVVENGY